MSEHHTDISKTTPANEPSKTTDLVEKVVKVEDPDVSNLVTLSWQMANSDSMRAPCFHGNSIVHMANGKFKRVSDICIGDSVLTEKGVTNVKYVLRTMCDNEICEMVSFSSGLCITPWHPIKDSNEWVFPSTIKRSRSIYCPFVYSFVLESDHTIIVNDTTCITLGHNMTDGILNHPYFGTHKVIDDLAVLDGGRGNPITISSVYINRDETDKICSIKRPYDFSTLS